MQNLLKLNILTIGIGVKRLKKQLRKAKTRTAPESSDAEDMEIECNTLESNSNKTQFGNTFNKCKIYFQVSVVILIQENSFECEEDFESECNISKSYKRIRPDGNQFFYL